MTKRFGSSKFTGNIWVLLIAGLLQSQTPTANASDWFVVGEHFHTTTDTDFSHNPDGHDPKDSYSRDGLKMLLARGEKAGMDAMIVTEHNSVATCFDPLFSNASQKLTFICGEEWTTVRSLHLGIINPPVNLPTESFEPKEPGKTHPAPEVEADARELVRKVHEKAETLGRRSLVVVNHPGYKMYRPTDSLRADAVEVLVPEYELPVSGRRWWLKQLASGARMVALGGSDFHACTGWSCLRHGDVFRGLFEEPVNLVYAESTSPNDIVSAIAAGRVVALAGLKYKNIRIEATAEANGKEFRTGDVVRELSAGQHIRCHVRVKGARSLRIALLGISGEESFKVLRQGQIDSDNFSADYEFVYQGRREALHVELYESQSAVDPSRHNPVAVSNPIYF